MNAYKETDSPVHIRLRGVGYRFKYYNESHHFTAQITQILIHKEFIYRGSKKYLDN